ncbi:hypothetical protein B0H10DRAFT_1940156 [Mycena sp. CBHHK59/15]|nr:hypothetical protein B0H10DRAFT_1940156 [Mycena sp. CBHHK59/15]
MVSECSSSTSCKPSKAPKILEIHLIDRLESLAAFYQQQLDWVDEITSVEIQVDEADSEDEQVSETDNTPTTSESKPHMHWRRQMKLLESKLNGRVQKRRWKSGCRREIRSKPQADYILSMFGKMVGTRMESCRRMHKLVAITSRSNAKPSTARAKIPGIEATMQAQ